MTTNRRKKITKLRGSRFTGYGPNRHRGTGQQGGAGRAGSGKKCDSKKTRIWGTKSDYFGTKGFVPRGFDVREDSINIRDVQDKLESWLSEGLITREGGVFVLDLGKLGYAKLLGAGKVVAKMKVSVPSASAKVVEKLNAAGCELVK